jgi:hypothetical protein
LYSGWFVGTATLLLPSFDRHLYLRQLRAARRLVYAWNVRRYPAAKVSSLIYVPAIHLFSSSTTPAPVLAVCGGSEQRLPLP